MATRGNVTPNGKFPWLLFEYGPGRGPWVIFTTMYVKLGRASSCAFRCAAEPNAADAANAMAAGTSSMRACRVPDGRPQGGPCSLKRRVGRLVLSAMLLLGSLTRADGRLAERPGLDAGPPQGSLGVLASWQAKPNRQAS